MDKEKLKVIELTDEELSKVSGGTDNQRHIKGETVYFYHYEEQVWMWGTFEGYFNGECKVSWNDTWVFPAGDAPFFMEASSTNVSEEYIR